MQADANTGNACSSTMFFTTLHFRLTTLPCQECACAQLVRHDVLHIHIMHYDIQIPNLVALISFSLLFFNLIWVIHASSASI